MADKRIRHQRTRLSNWQNGEQQVVTYPWLMSWMFKIYLEQDALAAMEAIQAKSAALSRETETADRTSMTDVTDAEMTYAGNTTTTNTSGPSSKAGSAPKKKVAKPKLSAKEKKERGVRPSMLRLSAYFI